MKEVGYHGSRLPDDPRRDVLWRTLWRHRFSPLVPADGCVVDLGCGYCDFINQVVARRRIAVDSWPGFPAHAADGVETFVTDATDAGMLPHEGVDLAFASNLFEHLPQTVAAAVLRNLLPKFSRDGTLALVQPNYRYASSEYFDDYTHVTAWSHVSLPDFLVANGYEILEVVPRFLPLTIKSRFPVHPLLIRAYMASPLKPMGKQMLVRARPPRRWKIPGPPKTGSRKAS